MRKANGARVALSHPNRPRQRRRLLAWHIAALVGLCTLPLGGLAFYFLSTGLHREIALAEHQRIGLNHVRQTVSILERVVKLAWADAGEEKQLTAELDQALASLDNLEISLATPVNVRPAPTATGISSESSVSNASALWAQAKATLPHTEDRALALGQLVSQLHESIFQTSDQTGLSSGPENEISALTDVVSTCLPLHVERLLHMHERLVADLRSNTWDDRTREAASMFVRLLEDEDARRLERSINAALEADARSSSVLESFQTDYPRQATAMLTGLRKLTEAVRPLASDAPPPAAPEEFDQILHAAFDSAVTGWNASINQLDDLVMDQISEAATHRNRALILAAFVSLLLIPIAWFYYRAFIRPGIQAMVNDAVENQRAAETARAEADESIRRLRQTQAALDDHCAVTVLDPQIRIVAINDRMCQLSRYTREELVGQPFAFVAGENTSADFLTAVVRGEIWHGSLSHRAKDGAPFWVDATMFPFRDQAGRPAEFVVIETNITELVEARETAESAVLAKSQFLAMMSHEIRTPMNGVIGFAQLLAETKLDDQQRDYARTILTSGESLLVIINDILDFSKLEAGRTELDMRPVALRLLVEDVLDLLATQARAKHLELVYNVEADVPEGILADGPRLRQILLNLVGNAVKFTSSGNVEVAVSWVSKGIEPRRLSFHVKDTGIGIPQERQDRLFKAFSQVDASVARNYGGTGLGLAISQHLVKLMGGEISVTSAPYVGSDFYFTLPVIEADVRDDLRTRALSAVTEIEGALRGRHILVVDDLVANQRLLERILAQYGATVVTARSAFEAKESLGRGTFDLIVLDYLMPEADGLNLANQIRSRPDGRTTPLILVASEQPEYSERSLDLFDAVILKPIRNQQFAAAAARALLRGQVQSEQSTSHTARNPNAAFASEHPLRLLVVDDNPVNLKVITATLKALGYSPLAFNEAGIALDRLREEKFDVILMDVQMPGMDGLEATRRIRSGAAGELNRRTRIIALTAGAMADERAACLSAGMDDFMAKPVPRGELLAKLVISASGLSQ